MNRRDVLSSGAAAVGATLAGKVFTVEKEPAPWFCILELDESYMEPSDQEMGRIIAKWNKAIGPGAPPLVIIPPGSKLKVVAS